MTSFAIHKPKAFRLSAASEFYAGFTPGSGMAAAAIDHLTLTFRLDGSYVPVAVALREEGKHLWLDIAGTSDQVAVERQVKRMLGLDVDSEAWLELGDTDLVLGELQRSFPGFLTAAKASPYDAATWAVIAPRLSPEYAARIKLSLAREHGSVVELHGRAHHVFPSPEVLVGLERVRGLPEEKVLRLRGIGQAALDGLLDAERLRQNGEAHSLRELQTLRGVGPWAASHIYFRGAAPHDGLPTTEPRLLHGLASAYRLRSPTVATLQRIAHGWRPFRMWACVLLMRHLARAGGWHAPGLTQERAAAGRAFARSA